MKVVTAPEQKLISCQILTSGNSSIFVSIPINFSEGVKEFDIGVGISKYQTETESLLWRRKKSRLASLRKVTES